MTTTEGRGMGMAVTTTQTLSEFLLARIAEDYAAADLVLRPYGDHASTNDAEWWPVEREWFRCGLSSDETPLLTRMTPQRVLAECEAKRRIVECHTDTDGKAHACPGRGPFDDDWRWMIAGEEVVMVYPCPTLRDLGEPYADHPDYEPLWHP